MAEGTVRVKGLSQLNRDFRKLGPELQKELRAELKAVAEPVATEARSLAARFGPKTVRGIAAGSRAGAAVVRQRNRKTTGKRPDFGVLQMRDVLIPAIDAKEEETVRGMERMLDRLGGEFDRAGV